MKRVLRTIFIIAVITMMGATVGETAKDGRFIVKDNETILDTRTNLMWAAKDNGSDINWENAKSHCENYRGGGYKDWRMPMQDELAGLYDANKIRPAPCYRSFDIHVAEELRGMDISKLDKSRHRNLYGQLSFFSVC